MRARPLRIDLGTHGLGRHARPGVSGARPSPTPSRYAAARQAGTAEGPDADNRFEQWLGHLLDVPSVITDTPGDARRTLEHLVELGHSSVAYVSGPEASWPMASGGEPPPLGAKGTLLGSRVGDRDSIE